MLQATPQSLALSISRAGLLSDVFLEVSETAPWQFSAACGVGAAWGIVPSDNDTTETMISDVKIRANASHILFMTHPI